MLPEKNVTAQKSDITSSVVCYQMPIGARFTKQGKLAEERNFKTVQIVVEISASD